VFNIVGSVKPFKGFTWFIPSLVSGSASAFHIAAPPEPPSLLRVTMGLTTSWILIENDDALERAIPLIRETFESRQA
jgi:hypothetical protein